MSGFSVTVKSANTTEKLFDNVTCDNLISSVTLGKINMTLVKRYNNITTFELFTADNIFANVEISQLTLGEANLALRNMTLNDLTFTNGMYGIERVSGSMISSGFTKLLLDSLEFRNLTFGNQTIANFVGSTVFGNLSLGNIFKNFNIGTIDFYNISMFNHTNYDIYVNGKKSSPSTNFLAGSTSPINSSSLINSLTQSRINLTNLKPENIFCNPSFNALANTVNLTVLNFTNYIATNYGNQTLLVNQFNQTIKNLLTANPKLGNMTMCDLSQITFGNLTGNSQMPLANVTVNSQMFGLNNETPLPSGRTDYIATMVLRFLSSIYFLVGANLITILFLIAMAYPLYQLRKKRSALVLVFSKTVLSIFAIVVHSLLYLQLYLHLLPAEYMLFMSSTEIAIVQVKTSTTQLHLLALAANRTLAVIFPIWYSSNVKEKFLWKLCIGIWTFSIVYHAIWALPAYPFMWQQLFLFYSYLSQICIYFSTFLYLLMSAKLIYLKCSKQNISNQSELDHVKISLICMLGMVPFLVQRLPEIIGGTNFYAANIGWFILANEISKYFSYITEDLCLLLLCKDFRRMFIPTWSLPKSTNAVVVPAAQMVGKAK